MRGARRFAWSGGSRACPYSTHRRSTWHFYGAEQLRERGHVAVAVQEEADFRGTLDSNLFTEAQRRNCALLTENTAAYIVLDAEYRGRHLAHWGLVFTSNRAFPRGKATTVGALVKALDELLRKADSGDPSSMVIWLQRSK